MPIIRVQQTIPTTFNNLGLPSPQPLPGTVDTEGRTIEEYIAYYERAGIKTQVLQVISGAGAIEQLRAFGIGAGPAPLGWQAGHEERAIVQQTVTPIPGSLAPVQTSNNPDYTGAPIGGPFSSNPGTVAGGGVLPGTPAQRATVLKLAAVAAVLYLIWK